jgi:hypothetical protein
MKINFDKLFSTNLESARVFLVFGNDASVIQRALLYLKEIKISVLEITEKDFIDLPALGTPSLFEDFNKDIKLITGTTEKSLKKFKTLSDTETYIFTSQTLRTTSSFVKYVQSLPDGLAIGCYEAPLLRTELNFYLKEFSLPQEQLSAIYHAFTHQPDEFYNFTKLLALLHGSSGPDDISKLINTKEIPDSDNQTLLFINNLKKSIAHEFPLPAEQYITVLRSIIRGLLTLYELKAINYQKDKLTKPLFFKDQAHYLTAARKDSSRTIKSRYEKLLLTEKAIKSSNSQSFNWQMFHMEQ